MYGAILGDIIGAPYEVDMGDKTKEFSLDAASCPLGFLRISSFPAMLAKLAFCRQRRQSDGEIANISPSKQHFFK